MSQDAYTRKAEELLNRAAQAENMKERGRLIDEAMHFHNLAVEVYAHSTAHANDDEGNEGELDYEALGHSVEMTANSKQS